MEQIALQGRPTIDLSSWVWDQLIGGRSQQAFAAAIGRAIVSRRWFGAKTRTIVAVEIVDVIALRPDIRLILVQLAFARGPAEIYQIPLALAIGHQAERLLAGPEGSLWVQIDLEGQGSAVLLDGIHDPTLCADLLRLIESESRRLGTMAGELTAWHTASFGPSRGDVQIALPPSPIRVEQSNSSVIYGDRLILKLFRRLEKGINPDLEMSAYLTDHGFDHVPPFAGAIEYRLSGQEPWSAAMLQEFVPNQGDAWQFTLKRLDGYLESLGGLSGGAARIPPSAPDGIARAAERSLPLAVSRAFDELLPDAERLGTRTAELHVTLAADNENPAFRPEVLTIADQSAFHERCQGLAADVFELLRGQLPNLSARTKAGATKVLGLEATVGERLRRLVASPIHAAQIRCHGDYHLGQVLVTENDYAIIDFEGEPARPLSDRRKKQLALRDVAGMIRSYHYASCSVAERAKQGRPPADADPIDEATRAWYFWTSVAFLAAYRRIAGGAVFLPASGEEFECLLETCLLEKALYELRYELNNRPDWVYLPLQALVDLVGDAPPH